MTASPDTPGLHGKLPSHGDFITRRLTRGFVEGWDEWLQRSMAASKAALGEGWLDIYLTSPIWCFALQATVCGGRAWAGVLMPSVDRVGRYFPLTLAVPLPDNHAAGVVVAGSAAWFDAARNLALSVLDQDALSLEMFDAAVEGLGAMAVASPASDVALTGLDSVGARGLCLTVPALGGLSGTLVVLAHAWLESRLGPYSLWWSEGSDRVAPVVLATRGLPRAEAFTSMLDGVFRPEHWLTDTSARVVGAQRMPG